MTVWRVNSLSGGSGVVGEVCGMWYILWYAVVCVVCGGVCGMWWYVLCGMWYSGGTYAVVGRVLLVDGGGSLRRALIDAELAALAEENEWEGIVIYGCVREVDELEDMSIGIQAMASIPVGANNQGIGEVDVPVNFGGVTFLPEDYLYADNTGVILSQEPLNVELEIDDDE